MHRTISIAGLMGAIVAAAVVTAVAETNGSAGSENGSDNAYRIDVLPAIEATPRDQVGVLRPAEARPLPPGLLEDLEERVQTEWLLGRQYGALAARLGIWIEYPLVNQLPDGQIVVPVVEDSQIPIRGRLVVPAVPPARRIALLLDVSESANRQTYLLSPPKSVERVSVLEGGLRATRLLLDWLDRERRELGGARRPDEDEVGVIAFGENTEPVITPGSSFPEILARLRDGRLGWPPGRGRSDLACALRLADDWLRDAPDDTVREIIVLTNGDLPHSGRFTDCDAHPHRGEAWRASCLASLNRNLCPASHRFDRERGRSDIARVFSFSRDVRGSDLSISVLLFQPQRPPRFYRELVQHTDGRLAQVVSLEGMERTIGSILMRETHAAPIESVIAHNLRTGDLNANLLDSDRRGFSGRLPLVPGANDIEILVNSEEGTAALLRFRVYSAPTLLEDYLHELRDENLDLEHTKHELADEFHALTRPRRAHELEVEVESAAPTDDEQ